MRRHTANWAITYYVMRNYEAAIPIYEKAIEMEGIREEYAYGLGFCHAFTDHCDVAIGWFEAALEVNPNSELARQGMAFCTD